MTPGDKLGPYDILAPLGAGGMGEVYRARDTKLGREVAIKVLPAAFARDPERLARFEREAKVLASLNHPNIAQIYGLQDRALVMELVPGEPLKTPLPLQTALLYARQIAEALEAAHDKGIIHRDLKPANIMVTPDGVVKVLDFGLAAVILPSAPSDDSPTLTMGATQAGVIMGTAGYMSPEQAAGKPVDKRADIWSFGVVLWEMLTAKRLFTGETMSHTLADVLRAPIDFSVLPKGPVRELVRRCLERDAKLRLRDIGEARIFLSQPQAAEEPAAPPKPSSPIPWIVAALGLSAAGLAWWPAKQSAPQPMARFEVEMGQGFDLRGIDAPHMIISPDGRRLVWQLLGEDGKLRLATRSLDEAKPTVLAGTEGATHQFFSPDGEWLGYHDRRELRKISIHGGAPVTICPLPNLRGASWGDDNTIVFSPEQASGLMRISANGGTPQPITQLDEKKSERTHRYPFVLPGSKAAIFFSSQSAGNYDNATIEAVALDTGRRTTLVQGGYFPRYSPSGHLLFMRQGTVFVVGLDAGKLKITGTPVPLLQNVRHHVTRGSAEFDFSRTGTMVYVEGKGTSTNAPLALIDAAGVKTPYLKNPQEYVNPRFSPDGKRLAFDTIESGKRDIWVYDSEREIKTRLTFAPGENQRPVWTPDGQRIAFQRADGIFWVAAGGGGEVERLTESKLPQTPTSFSPDGKVLAFEEERPGTMRDIRLLEIDRRNPARPVVGKTSAFVATAFNERDGMFSPDGKWFAYESNESGTNEVYVRGYPDSSGRWQISSGGGVRPRWTATGKELFYGTDQEKVMTVTYSAAPSGFVVSKPRLWSAGINFRGMGYDVTPDGKRLVVSDRPENDLMINLPTRAVFLLNFFDQLKRQ